MRDSLLLRDTLLGLRLHLAAHKIAKTQRNFILSSKLE